MKNSIICILTVLLAALISYGGTGVNFISYCCDDCRSGGVEVLVDDKCCDIHGHGHDSNHDACATEEACEHFCETMCCTLERISFEWNQVNNPIFDLEPFQIDLYLPAFAQAEGALPVVYTAGLIYSDRTVPPAPCPRAYLSLLTTLLI